MADNKSTDSKDSSKSGVWLDLHRKTVESSTGMSPAILLGSSFALAMGLFAWVGHQYDERHGTEPLGTLVGVAAGMLYGAYEVWKVTRTPTSSTESPDDDGDSDEKGP